MQACGKLSCTQLFVGVEAEKVLVVFEILNNSKIWLFSTLLGRICLWSKVPLKGNVTPNSYHR